MENLIKKNGLLYSDDLHTVLGVDISNPTFTGRIPFGAHFIDDEVFCECPYESFSIPDSVKKIGARQFENSLSLESVKLPSKIEELPSYLFAGCGALTKVKMPDTISVFPEGIFADCVSLTEIPFRTGLTEIRAQAMKGCSSVKNIIFPNTVTKIDSKACADCTSLQSVVFPSCIEEIAFDAFEGCTLLNSVRIDGDCEKYFVSEDDGCLYTKDGQIVVKISVAKNNGIGFFKENVDDEPFEDEIDDEEIEEDDTFYSLEIGATDEEIATAENEIFTEQGNSTATESTNLGNETLPLENKIPESEDMMIEDTITETMNENVENRGASVSPDELAKMFEKHEAEVENENKIVVNPSDISSKAQILIDSAEFSKILRFESKDTILDDNELFVIAEKTITDADGNEDFSNKLKKCCNSFANIHDFSKIIMLKGLPVENDEFMQFYYHFMSKKNVIFVCEAESPSTLSDYAKLICEQSNISLDKNELNEQRKNANIKSNMLIKLVIRDKYE